MSDRTPGPLKANDLKQGSINLHDAQGGLVAKVWGSASQRTNEANSAFFVRSWNSHDALLKALNWAMEELQAAHGAVWEKNHWGLYGPVVFAREAIAKAEAPND